MKKATVIACAIAALGICTTEAQAQTNTTPPAAQQQTPTTGQTQEENRQQITQEELPDAVKQSLQSDKLKDWQVVEVYKITDDTQGAETKAVYEVFFTNAEEKRAVARFDEQGKAVAQNEAEQE